ncbi:hypothetical protein E2562_025899 [Oryza meyeriana var. granulata]|uniref:Uncharacterized protein n=1 Tax=Oryza meyeriana var. granulata TaxID=110450 RepID=A0A6G1CK14_9ORYZ|nr:hypothetical protein E2562_025899 [Oryza meyeriana var. granulata]KAF0899954.1 hypothetical protein E2562_025899 [Oryza meyeriana var. granulata]KAF0899955.1 hypothetical protein E2562_025899 [Oryza meyeriana var. granulata]
MRGLERWPLPLATRMEDTLPLAPDAATACAHARRSSASSTLDFAIHHVPSAHRQSEEEEEEGRVSSPVGTPEFAKSDGPGGGGGYQPPAPDLPAVAASGPGPRPLGCGGGNRPPSCKLSAAAASGPGHRAPGGAASTGSRRPRSRRRLPVPASVLQEAVAGTVPGGQAPSGYPPELPAAASP